MPVKKDRNLEKRLKRKTCPGFGRQFFTRPGYMNHIGGALVAAELDIPTGEAEALWKRYGTKLMKTDPKTGERMIIIPDEEKEEG